jgi:hypothetical protein
MRGAAALKSATFAVVAIVAVILHACEPDPGKKEIEFAAAVAGAAGILYTIWRTVQLSRQSSAARFAERWNEPTFVERRDDVRLLVQGQKTIREVSSSSIAAVTNFFEEMSIRIEAREADEAMLKRFFKSAVIQSAAVLQDWIAERQKKQPTAYREYLKLAERWKDN